MVKFYEEAQLWALANKGLSVSKALDMVLMSYQGDSTLVKIKNGTVTHTAPQHSYLEWMIECISIDLSMQAYNISE